MSVDEACEPIHHQLMRAFSYSNRAVIGRTRRIGLKPGQPKVLEYVVGHEGCTQREIAHACVMDQSTVTSVLSRMEADGLIERRAKAGDRRAATVFLTPRGREAADQVLACCYDVDTAAWQGLSAAERAELSRLLACVITNLADHERQELA